MSVSAVGALVLAGWAFDVSLLKSVLPGLVTMKANTAAGLLLCGSSLWLLRLEPAPPTVSRAARVLAGLAVLLGAATALEHLSGASLGIDELLFRDDPGDPLTSAPGRMGLNTAAAFVLAGAALLLLDFETRRGTRPAQWLAIASLAIATIAIVGYAYSIRPLYGIASYTPMALHTSLAVAVLSTGLLAARPDRGLMAAVVWESPGGQTIRRMLPALVAVPFAAGWLRLLGQRAGLYGTEVGLVLFATFTVGMLMLLTYLTARPIDQADAKRRTAEAELRSSEARYRELFMDTLSANYASTPSGTLITCNETFARLFGFESIDDALAVNVGALYQEPNGREAFLAQVRERRRISGLETTMKRRDGGAVHIVENAVGVFDERGELVEIRGYIADVTQTRAVEEQLRQAQKLEAIGRLAGGIAHDFNNLLTAVLGYADIAREALPPGQDGEARAAVEEINTAAQRAAALTAQLLAFARRQVLQPTIVDLGAVLRGMEGMLHRLIGEHIELRTASDATGRVRVDRGQFEQVILNLAVNARDAMLRGGRLTIEVRDHDLTGGCPMAVEAGLSGHCVALFVTDTGVGMDEQTRQKLFEPFFTTKGVGKGTGLGLATVHGIVRQSGGCVCVDSAPGRGTTFKICLPRVDAPVEQAAAPAVAAGDLRGAETILLVEDETGVRQLMARTLTRFGYRVLAASDGEEAVSLAERRDGPIDLIVTDVVLPRIGGRELAGQLAPLVPDAAVLYMSGYTPDAIHHHGVLDGGLEFIQKPFTAADLGRRVRQVLDARAARNR